MQIKNSKDYIRRAKFNLTKVTAKARFDKELDKFGFTEIKNEKIKERRKKIILEYITAKKICRQFFEQ